MVKKAIDSRIPSLIRNGIQEKKRSFFVIVGDRQKDVIVNLYHILLNVDIKLNKSVLWAYKNKLLGFTSHRKKREKKIRKEIKRGIRDPDTEDPFELFVSTQNIRYVYYKETDKILGNTYGMCILQDFEAITPNLLARTIETVQGGGLVLLLLKGMNSLKQLYTLTMDIHARYRTEAHSDVVARFNERFILSLGSCEACLVIDDELNVLPISGARNVEPLAVDPSAEANSTVNKELERIKDDLTDSKLVSPLVKLAKTVDQAKALLTFVDVIAEKTLQSTVALTAARGRGKSAALGLAIAAAVAHGYSNVFITSPNPENLKTLFEFVFKGFDALDYQDHLDYTIIQSSNPEFNKAVVRVNIHTQQHRQIIQYIQPQDAYTLGQAELLVIDEAAAIPLPLVKKLMGPYLVFMASTINGYEGTGRSLSLKLISQLRDQARGRSKGLENNQVNGNHQLPSTRSLREITLSEPIRYSSGDAVEKWLNKLLCLDATLPRRSTLAHAGGTPLPDECQLLAVNRDTLFSFHPVSERFLHSMLSLYVASHYKNSPNDLLLMSDAPAHHLYVLVPPIPEDTGRLPEPLCVIQVALEGQISKESVQLSLSRGQRAGGDLIPWLISQQFQDDDFAGLSGARVVRIATNPEYIGMGYGRRALELLIDFYGGKFLSLNEDESIAMPDAEQQMVRVTDEDLEASALHTDNVKVRDIRSMPPLFSRLSEIRPPTTLDYIGVSYGLTQSLHKFWKRAEFVPVYLRQTANELTGEHTCVMLRTFDEQPNTWLNAFARDFHRRYLSLLSYNFRSFPSILALSIDESASSAFLKPQQSDPQEAEPSVLSLTKSDLDASFTPHDIARLTSYANNMLDHHVILDLIPRISLLYFTGSLRTSVTLTGVQKALLLGVGAQRRDIEDVGKDLGLASTSQTLGVWVKVCRKIATVFRRVLEASASASLPPLVAPAEDDEAGEAEGDKDKDRQASGATNTHFQAFKPLSQSLEDDLASGIEQVHAEEKQRLENLMADDPFDSYQVPAPSADGTEWADAQRIVARDAALRDEAASTGQRPKTVSVRRVGDATTTAHGVDGGAKRKLAGSAVEDAIKELEATDDRGGRSGKKKKHHKKG